MTVTDTEITHRKINLQMFCKTETFIVIINHETYECVMMITLC